MLSESIYHEIQALQCQFLSSLPTSYQLYG